MMVYLDKFVGEVTELGLADRIRILYLYTVYGVNLRA